MEDDHKRDRLRAYESYEPSGSALTERTFYVVFALTVLVFAGLGLLLQSVEVVREEFYERAKRISTEFIIREKPKKTPPPPEPPTPAEKPEEPSEPVDLTNKPKLAQKEDDIRKPTPQKEKAKRRVYGLRRVYSKGIGSGGKLSDAVVGKLGNTLSKDVDTLTATRDDIKGEVVSVTTITSMPVVRKRVRPEYTQKMLDNRVEGVVKVKILVDVDGKVKKANALNDLGFGTAKLAETTAYAMEFEPAKRGDEPVAVWLIVPVRFVVLG
jgi:hypothetical protein